MKRIVCVGLVFFSFVSTFITEAGSCTPMSGQRVWDLVAEYDVEGCTVLSQICMLSVEVDNDFSGTFTALDAILQKSLTTESILDQANSKIQIILNDETIIQSQLMIIDSQVDAISSVVATIAQDIAGVFTVIDSIEQTFSSQLDVSFSLVSELDQSVSQLGAIQEANFIETLSSVDVINADVLQALSKVEGLNALGSQLSIINSTLSSLTQQVITINSTVEFIENETEADFDGTFTLITQIQNKLLTTESTLENLVLICSVDFSAVYTVIAAIQSEADGVESKLNDIIDSELTIESKLVTLNSEADIILDEAMTIGSNVNIISSQMGIIDSYAGEINQLALSIDSKVVLLNNDFLTVDSKLNVLDSNVDVVLDLVSVQDSLIDVISNETITISSKIELLGSQLAIINDEVMSIGSKVDNLGSELDVIESKAFLANSALSVANSSIDVINSNLDQSITTISVIQSDIDVINSQVDVALDEAVTIESKVFILETLVDQTNSVLSVVSSELDSLDTKVIAFDSTVDFAVMQAMSISSEVDTINSQVDVALNGLVTLGSLLNVLEQDFNFTWTILASITNQANGIGSVTSVINSQVDALNVSLDLSGVYTSLARVSTNLTTIGSKMDVVNSKLAAAETLLQTDINGTFTVINAIINQETTVISKLSVVDSKVLIIQDAFGIPIFNSSLPLTINAGGKYYVAEQLSFVPTIVNQSINIAANNVAIDFRGRTMTGGGANVDGIRIAQNVSGVVINGGTIRNTSGAAINVGVACQDIMIDDMSVISTSTNGIQVNPLSFAITLNDCRVNNCAGHGVSLQQATDVIVQESIFNSNGTSGYGSGLYASDTSLVAVIDCIANNNLENGYTFTTITFTTIGELELIDCKAFQNFSGIVLVDTTNSVVQECIVRDSTDGGIRLHGCQYVEVSNCISSGNAGVGILLTNGTRTLTNNCFISDNVMIINSKLANLYEPANNGPNSVLGNFALATLSATDYVVSRTFINAVGMGQGTAFPAGVTFPTRWFNISGQTT